MEQLEANVELPPVAEPIVDVPLIVEAPAVVEPPVLAVEHEAPVVNEAALEGADGADAARIVVNVDVVVPSIAASAVTAPVQATVPVASFCVSCDCELTNSTRYTAITGCTPHCRDCLAQWTETQIMSGNSMTLKCLCGHHKLRYVDFRSLSTLLSTQAKTVYSTAQRQTASSAESVELECPGCATMVTVYAGQVTYECFNHNYCEAKNRLICVRHNTIHLRPLLERYGGGVKRDMHAQPRCARCLQEAGGNADVAAVLFEIQNAMCDRCYACKGNIYTFMQSAFFLLVPTDEVAKPTNIFFDVRHTLFLCFFSTAYLMCNSVIVLATFCRFGGRTGGFYQLHGAEV